MHGVSLNCTKITECSDRSLARLWALVAFPAAALHRLSCFQTRYVHSARRSARKDRPTTLTRPATPLSSHTRKSLTEHCPTTDHPRSFPFSSFAMLLQLPSECLTDILSRLPVADVVSIALTSTGEQRSRNARGVSSNRRHCNATPVDTPLPLPLSSSPPPPPPLNQNRPEAACC